MLRQSKILGSLASLGFLVGMVSTANAVKMPAEHSTPKGGFQRIEQPLATKIGVTVGGLALIGLELWWFLLSKPKAQRSTLEQGIQKLTIQVDGGYNPSQILLNAGQPVQLNFFRTDPSSCLEKVLIPDFHIAADLALNQVTPVEFTPNKPGEYPFTCGMNMFRGILKVK